MKNIILLVICLLFACNQKKVDDTPKVISIGDLLYSDLRDGLGEKRIQNGDFITVDYVGWTLVDSMTHDLYSDWLISQKYQNNIFQSSYSTKKPHQFTVGEGTVIRGWELGVIGMKEGAKRILNIPASLAYGTRGFGNAIQPNTNLRFELEILKIERPSPSKVISEKNSSGKKVTANSIVKFHYKLSRTDNQSILQNSFSQNTPGQITMSDPGLPHFIYSGLINLAVDGQRSISIPEFKPRDLPEMLGEFKVLKVIDPVFPWSINQTKTKSLENGLKYNIIEAGSGNLLKSGELITVHYSVYTVDGKKLFSTVERDLPLNIEIGGSKTLVGLSEGLKLLRTGSKTRLIIPENLSLAPDGSNQNLPKNIKLVFDLEVLN